MRTAHLLTVRVLVHLMSVPVGERLVGPQVWYPGGMEGRSLSHDACTFPTREQTDVCENITFPQLLLRSETGTNPMWEDSMEPSAAKVVSITVYKVWKCERWHPLYLVQFLGFLGSFRENFDQ